jgi:hypothetical protein
VALFLLGPSKWASGYPPPSLPVGLHEHLPNAMGSEQAPTPLDIRIGLARCVASDGHRVVVMEAHADRPGEPKAEKFSRLVRDEGAERFGL